METKAHYRFRQYRFEKGFEDCIVPVEILKATDTSYQIKLMDPNVNGRQYGDVIWVRKNNVIVPKEPVEVDYTDAWWNND